MRKFLFNVILVTLFSLLSLRGEEDEGNVVSDGLNLVRTKRTTCGWATLKGGDCKNPVGDGQLACHRHVSQAIEFARRRDEAGDSLEELYSPRVHTIQEMITTLQGGKMEVGKTIRYMVMSIDEESGRPYVHKRVLTNLVHKPSMIHLKDGEHLVPVDVGDDYHVAFMNELLPKHEAWVLEVVPVTAGPRVASRPTCALAWSDDVSSTFAYLPNHPYWGALKDVAGLKVTNHAKLAKRMKELARESRYFNLFPKGELNIQVFEPGEEPERYDGTTLIQPWVFENLGCPDAKRVSIRLNTEDALGKGDAIVTRRNSNVNADIVTSRDNMKSEFSVDHNGDVLVTAFVHHDHHEAMTDVQSLSWIGEHLFPIEEMKNCLDDVCNSVIDDLRAGIFPQYMEHDTSDEGLYGNADTIKYLRAMYNRWQDGGMDLNQSGYFIHSIGSGLLNRMKKGMRFPIPWASYVHVTTHDLLAMAGYNVDAFDGKVFYHEATGSLSLPGELFKELFKNHGGWDLDDSVRIMVREFTDGIKGVLLRSPNSWGEYSIVEIDLDSLEPILYNMWRDMPTMGISSKEFGEKLLTIHDVDKVVSYKGMPESAKSEDEEYLPAHAQAVIDAMAKSPGVGPYANAAMVYHASTGDFRKRQLAHTEDIVDVLTQTASAEGFAAIKKDIESTWKELAKFGSVERYFVTFDPRIPKDARKYLAQKDNGYLVTHDGYLTKLAIQHRLVTNSFQETLSRESNDNRVVIPELMEFDVSEKARSWAVKAVAAFKLDCSNAPKGKDFVFTPRADSFDDASRLMLQRRASTHYRDLNSRVVKRLVTDPNGAELLVALYQWTEYKRSQADKDGIDRILFAQNHPDEPSVMDLLLAFLNRKSD